MRVSTWGGKGVTFKVKFTEWQHFSQVFPNQRGGLKISQGMIPLLQRFLGHLGWLLCLWPSICDHTGWVWPYVLASETHGAEWTWTGVQSDLETTGSPGGVGGRNSHKPHPAGDDVCCLCSIWCPGPSHQSPGLWPWASVSDSVFWRRL